MVTPGLGQVRAWSVNAGVLPIAAARIDSAVDDFDNEMNTLTRDVDAVREMWRGASAQASAAATDSERQFGNRLGIAILDIADGINRFAPAFARTCATAVEAAESIDSLGYLVTEKGAVGPPIVGGPAPRDLPATASADVVRQRAAEHQHRLQHLLADVGVADADLARHVARAVDSLTVAAQRASQPVDVGSEIQTIIDHRRSLPSDSRQLNELWNRLSAMEKAALWNADRSIGNRDGIPATDRDHFNRRHLAELQRDERARIARYVDTHPYLVDGRIPRSPGPGGYLTEARRRSELDDVTRTHRSLIDLERALEQPPGADPRHLLLLDRGGRVAVAVNNPDVARNVATFVPGTGANAGNVGGGIKRAQAMVFAADKADPAASTSVIAWYAYEAPTGLAAAAGPGSAAHAAGPLDDFQAGLRATHEGVASHNTVVAHSYGTVVVGEAASQGHILEADDLVFVGSPGVGGPDSPSDLRLAHVGPERMADHVYATTAVHDPIGMVEGIHGRSPADTDFGAKIFAADPGSPYTGEAHSQYWDIAPNGRMNRALEAMGMIITGRGGEVR